MDELTFEDSDGVEVFYRRWTSGAAAGGTVVMVHGASEHSGRYARFAGALNERGYAVYALDQRGHGRTAEHTGPGRMGPRGIDGMLDDLVDLTSLARAEPDDPMFLFGHSMGSLIAQAFVERRDVALTGLVLSGSLGVAEGRAEMLAGLQAAVDGGMGDEPVDILGANNAAFEPARTPFDWLSRDSMEVDKYIDDPLCGSDLPLTYGFVLELVRAMVDTMTPAGISDIAKDLPVLLVTGDEDPVSGSGAYVRELERLLRAAGLAVDARYYDDARHELLNETNRDDVTNDILGWLDEVAARSGAGAA